jgi:hypothetical protein
MPDTPAADLPDDVDSSAEHLVWEVPEIAAVAVLAASGALMAGGLVAGIVASRPSYGGGTSFGGGTSLRIAASTAISFGATWAGPLLAIALLGVVGLCWWQVDAWSAASEQDDAGNRLVESAGHIRRAHRMCLWTQVALLLICVGAAALVVGSTLLSTGGLGTSPVNSARVIVEVTNLLAVLTVAGVGAWIGRKVNVDPESSD